MSEDQAKALITAGRCLIAAIVASPSASGTADRYVASAIDEFLIVAAHIEGFQLDGVSQARTKIVLRRLREDRDGAA